MKFNELHKSCAKYRDTHTSSTNYFAVLNQLMRVCFENGDIMPNVFNIHTVHKDIDVVSILSEIFDEIFDNYTISTAIIDKNGIFISYEVRLNYEIC